ncbi:MULTISPECIES: hypothetical protein [Halobacterium]|uniref:hypothetical protein n=1 Tax=Halobacterium TaxID=2239 RepID=UPI00073F1D49|nr:MULTISPECIES: hypothetical protein [Halobacterium]MCG1003001.1 hypothetical protein [Halobacterium noricense]
MAARDLLLFGIAVILTSGFVLLHDVLRYGGRGIESTAVFYYGVFVGLGFALLGTLAASGD